MKSKAILVVTALLIYISIGEKDIKCDPTPEPINGQSATEDELQALDTQRRGDPLNIGKNIKYIEALGKKDYRLLAEDRKYYQNLTEKYPAESVAWYLLGYANLETQKNLLPVVFGGAIHWDDYINPAIDGFTKAISLSPESLDAYHGMVDLYEYVLFYKDAYRYQKMILEKVPNDLEANLRMLDICKHLLLIGHANYNDPTYYNPIFVRETYNYATKVLDLDPNNVGGLMALMTAYGGAGDYIKAISVGKMILKVRPELQRIEREINSYYFKLKIPDRRYIPADIKLE